MRRTIPAALALALTLALGATPILATDEEPAADETTTQRAEAPELGLALQFPADWNVSRIEGERVSAVTDADGQPVMETTVLYANAGGGTWCDIDAYLDMPPDTGLEGFAAALVDYMQQNEDADAAMVVAEEELAIGPSYRIEIFNQSTGRIRGLYLFDGPAREDGSFERYLLTCAAREVGEPFWADIAASTEFFEPVAVEEEMAEEG